MSARRSNSSAEGQSAEHAAQAARAAWVDAPEQAERPEGTERLPAPSLESALHIYHDALAGEYFEQTVDALAADRRFNAVAYGGRPVCTVLRPAFITERQYAEVQRAGNLILRGVDTVYRRALADEGLRRRMMDPEDASAWQLDGHLPQMNTFGRLDGVRAADGTVRFLENNTAPAGLADMDVLGECFCDLRIMDVLRRRFSCRWVRSRARAGEALRAAAARVGLSEPIVASWAYASSKFAIERWERTSLIECFHRHGIPVIRAPLDAHEVRGGKVYVDGTPVHVMIGGDPALSSKLPPRLARAFQEGAIRHATGFATRALTGGKPLLAILSDPLHASFFEPEVAAAIRRHIPWTRIVAEERTDYRGAAVDLLPFIADNAAKLVLKPGFGMGGAGVRLGWRCTPEQWRQAITDALSAPYVVQERVSFPKEEYPYVNAGRLDYVTLNQSLDPFHFGGAGCDGCFVRMNEGDLLNIATIGGAAPLVILGGEDA